MCRVFTHLPEDQVHGGLLFTLWEDQINLIGGGGHMDL